MVVQPVLHFVANAKPNHQVWTYAPVILEECRTIGHEYLGNWVVNNGGCILRRSLRLICRQRTESVHTVAAGGGIVCIRIAPCPYAEPQGVVASRCRAVVLKLKEVLAVVNHATQIAAAHKSTRNHYHGRL